MVTKNKKENLLKKTICTNAGDMCLEFNHIALIIF